MSVIEREVPDFDVVLSILLKVISAMEKLICDVSGVISMVSVASGTHEKIRKAPKSNVIFSFDEFDLCCFD